jgi:hypothetical protein
MHRQPTTTGFDTEREQPSQRRDKRVTRIATSPATLSFNQHHHGARSEGTSRYTPVEHDEEHDNTTSAHKVVHAAALAVEPPPDDRVPGAHNPPLLTLIPHLERMPKNSRTTRHRVSTHPPAPTAPPLAAVSAPTPTLSLRGAPLCTTRTGHVTATRREHPHFL